MVASVGACRKCWRAPLVGTRRRQTCASQIASETLAHSRNQLSTRGCTVQFNNRDYLPVAQEVAGSKPVGHSRAAFQHPEAKNKRLRVCAGLAWLITSFDCHALEPLSRLSMLRNHCFQSTMLTDPQRPGRPLRPRRSLGIGHPPSFCLSIVDYGSIIHSRRVFRPHIPLSYSSPHPHLPTPHPDMRRVHRTPQASLLADLRTLRDHRYPVETLRGGGASVLEATRLHHRALRTLGPVVSTSARLYTRLATGRVTTTSSVARSWRSR